jgi:hypothetical protein
MVYMVVLPIILEAMNGSRPDGIVVACLQQCLMVSPTRPLCLHREVWHSRKIGLS